MSLDRRAFLRLIGASPWIASPLAAQAMRGGSAEDRRLVLVFLEGGNDGLNTVVPYTDDAYFRARPKLALSEGQRFPLDEQTALHVSLQGLSRAWEAGELAVLRDVGYARPDLSHFVSRDIWHSGRRDEKQPKAGWVGRAILAGGPATALPPAALGVAEAPLLLKNQQTNGLTIESFDRFAQKPAPLPAPPSGASDELKRIARAAQEAQQVAVRMAEAVERVPAGEGYPATRLAQQLRLAARLVRVEAGPPVLCVRLGGFDTHSLQAGTHAALLRQLGDALASFYADLGRDQAGQRTLTLVYSEFGRRVRENGSAGTDHGTAGPMFALGGRVQGGVHGRSPDLELPGGNLTMQHDLRAVFSETLRAGLGWSAREVFDGGFEDGRARVGFLPS